MRKILNEVRMFSGDDLYLYVVAWNAKAGMNGLNHFILIRY